MKNLIAEDVEDATQDVATKRSVGLVMAHAGREVKLRAWCRYAINTLKGVSVSLVLYCAICIIHDVVDYRDHNNRSHPNVNTENRASYRIVVDGFGKYYHEALYDGWLLNIWERLERSDCAGHDTKAEEEAHIAAKIAAEVQFAAMERQNREDAVKREQRRPVD